MLVLKYKLFNLGTDYCGITPAQMTQGSAGYDLYIPTAGIIKAGGIERINLQIGFEFNRSDWCLHMYGRSSALAVHGLVIPTTIIDFDYRGPVHLIAYNSAQFDFMYSRGDRLCQVQAMPVFNLKLEEVTALSETERNHKGLGSTGK